MSFEHLSTKSQGGNLLEVVLLEPFLQLLEVRYQLLLKKASFVIELLLISFNAFDTRTSREKPAPQPRRLNILSRIHLLLWGLGRARHSLHFLFVHRDPVQQIKNASHTNLTKSDTSPIVVYSALTTPDYYINQKQINYFQFPPTELLLDPASSTSISTPSLATTTAVALAASSVSNCGANTISSTSCSLDCASANNSPKSIYHYLHHHQHHSQLQRSPSHAITMGRREIKRSNTSGSTVKSYDSGSDVPLEPPEKITLSFSSAAMRLSKLMGISVEGGALTVSGDALTHLTKMY
uniref:Uncharacterized protein n=1 Tax=Glossina pallidipes TaxID=7398 RepID=A0A1A9Z7C9_GLOPL